MVDLANDAMGLFPQGGLALGCNYWASHAGTNMWQDWQPSVVDADMASLAKHGVRWLRVFPLWPDFQPIKLLRTHSAAPYEYRLGEEPLGADALGQAGLSSTMVGRFREMCALAEKHDLKLVVGLITGWMSGRLFVPPALEGMDPISDARSIAWQIRFVREFVSALKDEGSIAAWDLGNECNCMGVADNPDVAYTWTAAISSAIKRADPSRSVVSGMHTLSSRLKGHKNPWLIEDQGELTDILTTHPYPYWVRHAELGHVDDFRTTFHATAETSLYRDISGKPCIVEEVGTMGPMIASDEVSAKFARVNMWSLWANDCRAFGWWCAYDQTGLDHAPYDWFAVETELGLVKADHTAKPVLEEFAKFQQVMERVPNGMLPAPAIDAVCILSDNQDDWAAAYGSFILAKQAKLQLAYCHVHQVIPEADIYILPSLTGPNCIPKRVWLELLRRAMEGATLYVSFKDGIVPHFVKTFGAEIVSRSKSPMAVSATILDGGHQIDILAAGETRVKLTSGEAIATRDDTGHPVFWLNRLGKGSVYALAFPVEVEFAATLLGEDNPYWRLYAQFSKANGKSRLIEVADPAIAVTEHEFSPELRFVVMINHSREARRVEFSVSGEWEVTDICKDDERIDGRKGIEIPGLDAVILRMRSKH